MTRIVFDGDPSPIRHPLWEAYFNQRKALPMTKDVYYLGPSPSEEPCAQTLDPDYNDRALRECRAYIEAIRKVCGDEPEGALLRVKREAHEFGDYYECVVEFDGDNGPAATYAARVDEHAPKTWEEASMQSPAGGQGRGR